MKIILIIERVSGLYILERLLKKKNFKILFVLTDLDVEKYKWWSGSTIEYVSKKNNIPCYSSSDVNIIDELMGKYDKPDLSINVLNNNFRSKKFLNWVGHSINIHGAPLPEYQGNNCTHFAILNDEKSFGATAYMTTTIVDEGDIIKKELFQVPTGISNIDLYKLTIDATKRLIDYLISKKFKFDIVEKFDKSKSCYYNELGSRKVNELDWDSLDKISRAFYFPPFEPAYYEEDENKFYLIPEQHYKVKI